MNAVYNPESDLIARIETLEREIRELRRRLEHAGTADDKRVLNQQICEMSAEFQRLRERLKPRPPRLSAGS